MIQKLTFLKYHGILGSKLMYGKVIFTSIQNVRIFIIKSHNMIEVELCGAFAGDTEELPSDKELCDAMRDLIDYDIRNRFSFPLSCRSFKHIECT